MAELMSLHGWAYPSMRMGSSPSDTPKTKTKALSPSRSPGPDTNGRSPSPNKTVLRARSTNALTDMAASAASSFRSFPSSSSAIHEENALNTLKDPRTASTSDLSSTTTNHNSSPRHPDLSNEVATLSDKLIQAINNQTMLDATLSSTRQELDAARAKIDALEQKCREHEQELSSGRLVKTHDIEIERSLMRDALEDEKSRRITAEKEKKGIEQELENLTAALFEEANKMVAAAKKEREGVERKNDQLRAQIKDTELLVASHQEQLAELKATMQQMNQYGDREDADSRTNPSTGPTSPAGAASQHESIGRLLDAMNLSPATPGSEDISPAPSTSFAHLIKSVCRTDIPAYEDFRSLLHQASATNPHSRAGSASSYGGLNVMGLGNFSSNNQSSSNLSNTNGATSNATSGSGTRTPTPSGLASPNRDPQLSTVPLKETRFYKRVLNEDIEPALRLDSAPSISWLTRRSVLSSICEGGLVIEPMPSIAIKYSFPCSLCGERRKDNENPRLHRFRTSDSESAQRYPLCMVCLERMRACCDFVGYLRLIVDGHVRAADEEDEKEAWEETVRLRERLFWARIGGGVVPAFIQKKDSERGESASVPGSVLGRPSRDGPDSAPLPPRREDKSLDIPDDSPPAVPEKDADPFTSKVERVSIGNTVISINGVEEADAEKKDTDNDVTGPESLGAVNGDVNGTQNSDSQTTSSAEASKDADEPQLHETDEKAGGHTDSSSNDADHTDPPRLTNGDTDDADQSASHTKTTSVSSITSNTSKARSGPDPTLKVAIPASSNV